MRAMNFCPLDFVGAMVFSIKGARVKFRRRRAGLAALSCYARLVAASKDIFQLMHAVWRQIANDVHKIEFNKPLYAVDH